MAALNASKIAQCNNDGNIERVIKRLLNLKSETEISKENLIKKKRF